LHSALCDSGVAEHLSQARDRGSARLYCSNLRILVRLSKKPPTPCNAIHQFMHAQNAHLGLDLRSCLRTLRRQHVLQNDAGTHFSFLPCIFLARQSAHLRRDFGKVVEGTKGDKTVGEGRQGGDGGLVKVRRRVAQEAARQAHELLHKRLQKGNV